MHVRDAVSVMSLPLQAYMHLLSGVVNFDTPEIETGLGFRALPSFCKNSLQMHSMVDGAVPRSTLGNGTCVQQYGARAHS